MAAWKIGSGEVFNQPLINLIIELGGPILLSSGMSNWNDIEKVVNHTKKKGQKSHYFNAPQIIQQH